MIYQTLTAAGVKFTWHEFNAAHAFLRDEGLRYDPETAALAWSLIIPMLQRTLR
jgi:carboxymethylenebutenolidase